METLSVSRSTAYNLVNTLQDCQLNIGSYLRCFANSFLYSFPQIRLIERIFQDHVYDSTLCISDTKYVQDTLCIVDTDIRERYYHHILCFEHLFDISDDGQSLIPRLGIDVDYVDTTTLLLKCQFYNNIIYESLQSHIDIKSVLYTNDGYIITLHRPDVMFKHRLAQVFVNIEGPYVRHKYLSKSIIYKPNQNYWNYSSNSLDVEITSVDKQYDIKVSRDFDSTTNLSLCGGNMYCVLFRNPQLSLSKFKSFVSSISNMSFLFNDTFPKSGTSYDITIGVIEDKMYQLCLSIGAVPKRIMDWTKDIHQVDVLLITSNMGLHYQLDSYFEVDGKTNFYNLSIPTIDKLLDELRITPIGYKRETIASEILELAKPYIYIMGFIPEYLYSPHYIDIHHQWPSYSGVLNTLHHLQVM